MSPLELKSGTIPDLRVGDIILVRHRWSLMRLWLRRITRSHWDHVALVVFPQDAEKGYSSDIIVEAIQHSFFSGLRRGTEVHKIGKYLMDPRRYEIGIRRFPGLSPEMKERIRSFMLVNIDSPYHHLWISKFFFAWILPPYRNYLMRFQRYSCSSLIQIAFYEAFPWEERPRAMFRDRDDSPIETQELVTPADIARTGALKWVYNEH